MFMWGSQGIGELLGKYFGKVAMDLLDFVKG